MIGVGARFTVSGTRALVALASNFFGGEDGQEKFVGGKNVKNAHEACKNFPF